ncbi:MAG: FHA domain-containing protein [Anaerolineae bacterium]
MSKTVESVFNEYTRLRLHGLEMMEAVRTLHPHLQDLDSKLREDLAALMRAWENNRTESIPFVDREQLAAVAMERDNADGIACPKCGKSNELDKIICYACGSLLTLDAIEATKRFEDSNNTYQDELFKQNNVLIISAEHNGKQLKLYPQLGTHQLSMGRKITDVDLEPFDANDYGVSRLHATINYNESTQNLSIFDMGSTNGTFINGQRLHANEQRVIRHGDLLQLGQLKLRIIYHTP